MDARRAFLKRFRAIGQSHSLAPLVSQGFGEQEHNERARVLRCGLMVQTFSSLESFLRQRTQEVLRHVATGPAPFSSLPDGLQIAATKGAVESLAGYIRTRGRDAGIELVQAEAGHIASTRGVGFSFSSMSFLRDKSNVANNDLRTLLEMLGIGPDPWFEMTAFAGKVGLGSLPLSDAFRNAANGRHGAAHDPEFDVEPLALGDAHRASLAVAISFDALLSRAGLLLYQGNTARLGEKRKIQQGEIRTRMLEKRRRDWAEIPQGRRRAAFVHRSREPDVIGCVTRARAAGEFVVLRDEARLPFDWVPVDCP